MTIRFLYLMAKECDEYDDWNRYAEQQEQNGTHWETLRFQDGYVSKMIRRRDWI